MAPATTIGDVARSAGVSAATVSRVLNNHPEVDAELAERVRTAVQALKYQPNRIGRTLRTRRSQVWALVIADICNPGTARLVRGVEDVAYAVGCSVVLCNAQDEPAKEASYLDREVAEGVGGVILAPSSEDVDVAALVERGVPLVITDGYLADGYLDCVVVDDGAGVELAVAHLVEGRYCRIAFICGPRSTIGHLERYSGYCRAMEASGRPVDESRARVANHGEDGGYEAMRDLLAAPGNVDAVVVADSLMTRGAWRAIADMGLAVPRDIGIVGFDDTARWSLAHPSLSVISRPSYDLGVQAARLLLRRVEGGLDGARTVVLTPSLVVRQSSVRGAQRP